MKIAVIGSGAIAGYVQQALDGTGVEVAAIVVRPGQENNAASVPRVATVSDLPDEVTHVVECAGHQALVQHGPSALRSGRDVIAVSIGALADPDLARDLRATADTGGSRLHLASGAIGALDALRAARVGGLKRVDYIGRKPPSGWIGSPAEDVLDLRKGMPEAQTHFKGSAGEAALRYPKNANVAAAVALAGVGFEATHVRLIADPKIAANVHEVHAEGAFGAFSFTISGNSLPDNPRSSALAAMSVVASILEAENPISGA